MDCHLAVLFSEKIIIKIFSKNKHHLWNLNSRKCKKYVYSAIMFVKAWLIYLLRFFKGRITYPCIFKFPSYPYLHIKSSEI